MQRSYYFHLISAHIRLSRRGDIYDLTPQNATASLYGYKFLTQILLVSLECVVQTTWHSASFGTNMSSIPTFEIMIEWSSYWYQTMQNAM